MSRRGLGTARMVVALLCAAIVGMLVPSGASASTLPTGFEETTVLSGVGKPQDIAIAPNGRVFVAEKTGFIRTFDSVDDTTPTLFVDLRKQVHNFGSRGLLSIVTDPGFPGKPYVYVYYTMDAPLGGTPPVYGAGPSTRARSSSTRRTGTSTSRASSPSARSTTARSAHVSRGSRSQVS